MSSNGVWSLGGALGAESLRVNPVASAVNFWDFYGGVSGSDPYLFPGGSDANRGLIYLTKGSGTHLFMTGTSLANTQFAVAHTASAVNYLQVTGDSDVFPKLSAQGSGTNVAMVYVTKGNQSHFFQTSGGTNQFVVGHTASAVNFLHVTGALTNVGPSVEARGSDANIDLGYITKGTGSHFFTTGGGVSVITQLLVSHTASAVNRVQVTGSATGNAATISTSGSDTNIDLALTPKGTGLLRFGTYTAGILAQTGYIQIKDAAGNTRNLLVG
jgi:hypothetical protein